MESALSLSPLHALSGTDQPVGYETIKGRRMPSLRLNPLRGSHILGEFFRRQPLLEENRKDERLLSFQKPYRVPFHLHTPTHQKKCNGQQAEKSFAG